ncbi:protein CIP2A homolog [Amyelois transitella]|uniref:protein CIP2A homolog n=1 Tax=Amyelois transitella TaxID=680683 RepID=UPI00299065B5|nr:protein CIP2A homolog [Amyelois transitella]
MEVDGAENWNNNPADGGKFVNLKAFVTAAREFEATHSENAVNLMTRYLGLIASSCDLTIFSPGRSEVCAFFSSLWRVMCDSRGPHWAGVAVLSRAAIEPSARHALTHTYKFMPILSRLLTDSISNDKKIKVLSVMQDISYGIKISWQESYLSELMKQLTDWITQPMTEPQHRMIGHKSLTVLVNVCYGNLPAIYALMRTVDTKEFVVHLISLKDGGYGGVEVCRLLLCLSGATRGAASTRQPDVHSYLCCTMRTFNKAVVERDSTQLLHAYTFINDLCTDSNLRGFVLTYPNFTTALKDGLPEVDSLCKLAPDDTGESEQVNSCLRNALKFLTVLVNLDLYSLRCYHIQLVCLCMKASRVSLPEALELFAAIVLQYRDEGRLPQELISVISDGLPSLLVPPSLEPGKAGLQWLQVLGALCESSETQERVLHEVTPDTFEDTLYNVLQYTSQNGTCGVESAQSAVVVACRTALCLAPLSRQWDAALNRLLAHHQVRKMLCAGLTSGNGTRRKQILQLVKHHYFPSDQMSQVFGESVHIVPESPPSLEAGDAAAACCAAVRPQQERAVDGLVARLADALTNGKISDIATSSVMELYGYKMTCLEQRLHSHSVALQGASEHMASLQHSLAMLQATNSSQQDVLYTTQMQNEKHKQTIDELHKQLEDAETTLRGFRAKLAAERLDKENQKENLQKQFKQQINNMEGEMKAREREMEDRLKQAESEYKALQKKLEQQTNKNSELAGVLIKFEERVKQRDKRLEDASETENSLKRELAQRDNMIKQLEKTVAERENRLYQVTSQLEEMKRVQEMVAKLMSKSSATPAS